MGNLRPARREMERWLMAKDGKWIRDAIRAKQQQQLAKAINKVRIRPSWEKS